MNHPRPAGPGPGARVIAVMARPLVRGAVKTRLARALGDDGALAVYERLLRGTLDGAELVPNAALVLAEAPAAAGEPAVRLPVAGDPLAGRDGRWSRLPQRGDGLGERLANVFADLFGAGAETVVVVGSDSPALPAEYLAQALDDLSSGRLVLGPTADGGYYLIGAGRETWAAAAGALTGDARGIPDEQPRPARAHAARGAGRRPAGRAAAALGRRRRAGRPRRARPARRSRAAARRAARRSARGLPSRHAPLRPRLPALLRLGGDGRGRADDGRVARRHRPVRRARRRQLRLHRRRPAGPRRLPRAARSHHRRARCQSAVLLQQPGGQEAGGRAEPHGPGSAEAAREHRRAARGQRRAARPPAATTTS